MGEINLRIPNTVRRQEVTLRIEATPSLLSCVEEYLELQRQMLSATQKWDEKRDQYRTSVTGWICFLLLVVGIVYAFKVLG